MKKYESAAIVIQKNIKRYLTQKNYWWYREIL